MDTTPRNTATELERPATLPRATIRTLEMDDIFPPKADPIPAPVIPAPAVEVGKVEKHRATAARQEREMANELLAMDMSGKARQGSGATWFDEGTVVMNPEAALQGRSDWEKRPLVADCAAAHYETIKGEERKDYSIPVNAFRVNQETGIFTHKDGQEFSLSDLAFRQLAATVGSPNVSSRIAKCTAKKMLRTMHGSEGYALLGAKYPRLDSNELMKIVEEIAPKDARIDLKYDPEKTRTSIDVSLANPYEIEEEIGVGRLHRIGGRITSKDNGLESIRASAYAERIRCINCTLVQSEHNFTRQHRGSVYDLKKSLRAFFANLSTAMDAFSEKWRDANINRLLSPSGQVIEDPTQAFKLLISNGYLKVNNVKPKELLANLLTAHRYEPGDTFAAYQRAATRAAHAGTWKSQWVTEELEVQASDLLYAKVRTPSPGRIQPSKWAEVSQEWQEKF